ncbi:MAG: ROK family protein, partial [Pyrinomonadaceae bacterium]
MPANPKINFAGIEVAQSTMRGVVVSESGEVITSREATYKPEDLIKTIAELTSGLREAGDLKSVGLAIPGLVNRETDRVLFSTGLPFTAQEHIHAELIE